MKKLHIADQYSKKAVAFLLVLCLSLSVAAVGKIAAVHATDVPGIQAEIDSAASGATVTLAEDCAQALSVGAEKEITLDIAGHTVSATLTNNGTLTLIDTVGTGKFEIVNNSATEATTAAIVNNGTLTVDGVTVECVGTGNGSIMHGISNNGILTFADGEITVTSTGTKWGFGISNAASGVIQDISGGRIRSYIANAGSGCNAVAVLNNGTVKNISGGKLYAESNGTGYATALRNNADAAKVERISGGELSALVTNANAADKHIAYGVYNQKGTIEEISGGKIAAKTTATQWAFGIWNQAVIDTISGGAIMAEIEHTKNAPNAIALSNNKTVQAITGGTFYAVSSCPSGSTIAIRSQNAGSDVVSVSGGAYYINKMQEGNYLFATAGGKITRADGYELSDASSVTSYRYILGSGETYTEVYPQDGNTMIGTVQNATGQTVKEYVLTGTDRGDAAAIGDKQYDSVNAAVAASAAGDTVQVLKDGEEGIGVPAGKDVTVDLCGKEIVGTVSVAEGATLRLTDSVGTGRLYKKAEANGLDPLVFNRGTLTIENVNMRIDGRNNTAEADGINNYAGASLTMTGGRLRALSYGTKWSHGIVNEGTVESLADAQIESISLHADSSSNIVALSVIGGGTVKKIDGGLLYAQSYGTAGSAVGIRTQGTGKVQNIGGTVKAVVNSTKSGTAKAYGIYTEGADSAVAVADGTVVACNYTDVAYGIYNKGKCTVSGGYIAAQSDTAHTVHNTGTLTISGGVFDVSSGGAYIDNDNGTATYAPNVTLRTMEHASARYAAADGDVVVEQLDGETLIGVDVYRNGESQYAYHAYRKSGYYLDTFLTKGESATEVDIKEFAALPSSVTVYGSYQKVPLYYFLGSSVTYGHANNGSSFVNEISSSLNAVCVKEAVSGTTLANNGANSYVARMLSSFDKNAKAEQLIVQLSTNDATQNAKRGTIASSKNIEDFDNTTTIGAIEYIIAYAKKTWDCEVTFYTNPKYNNDAYASLVADLYAVQEKWGIGIVDFYNYKDMDALSAATLSSYMADAIHPNAHGYRWMGEVFTDYLRTAFSAKHHGGEI